MFDIIGGKKSNKLDKSGYTILELVITIALFAVVSLLITSMTMYINNFTNNRRELVNMKNEVSECEESIKNWFYSYNDAYSNINLVSSDPEDGYFINIDDAHYLLFEDGTLKIKEGDAVTSSYSFDHVVGLTFEYEPTLGLINCHIQARGEKKTYVYDVLLYKKV